MRPGPTGGAFVVPPARFRLNSPLARCDTPELSHRGTCSVSGARILSRTVAAGMVCSVALSDCSTAADKVVRAERVRPAPEATPELGWQSSPPYFSEATAIDLFQLRAADLAMQRATGRARSFALEARRQHEAISAQMSFAGRFLNLLPSRILPPEYQRMLTALLSSPDFNSVYLTQERVICARALRLHTDFAQRGRSPTLRSVARFASNAVQSEVQALGH